MPVQGDVFLAKLLHEFRNFAPRFRGGGFRAKLADMWQESAKHDALFSDYTEGDIEQFVAVVLDPASVWLEIVREGDEKVLGSAYFTDVAPRFDAVGHFTFWDSRASGREEFLHNIMAWAMHRYDLHRVSAEIPQYQHGWISFLEGKLQLTKEGVRREGTLKDGEWVDMNLYGMLREELKDILREYDNG